jgi:hypothetical protein
MRRFFKFQSFLPDQCEKEEFFCDWARNSLVPIDSVVSEEIEQNGKFIGWSYWEEEKEKEIKK